MLISSRIRGNGICLLLCFQLIFLRNGPETLISCLQDSIEERLGALDIDVSKVKTPGGLPQTDSFAVLLVQGLESNDEDILNVSVA